MRLDEQDLIPSRRSRHDGKTSSDILQVSEIKLYVITMDETVENGVRTEISQTIFTNGLQGGLVQLYHWSCSLAESEQLSEPSLRYD